MWDFIPSTNSRKFSLLLVLVAATATLLSLPQAAEAQAAQLNIFWYTDKDDLIPGKTPDRTIGPGSDPYGKPDLPLDPGEKKGGEKTIDTVRGSVIPKPSDMLKPNWDPALETEATKSATQCDGGAGEAGTLTDGAEIVVASTKRISFAEALNMVKAEGATYDYTRNDCDTPCPQYKLLISADVKNFACARAHCVDTALPYRIHCILKPKSKHVTSAGDKPYTAGPACQRCPRDSGYCYNNLCVSHDVKQEILNGNPTAVITCDAPCLNCGQRKDENKICHCDCGSTGFSGIDCSARSGGGLSCGACGIAGTRCRNGGVDSGDATCRCLCPREFRGRLCEYPADGWHGGVQLPIAKPDVCIGSKCVGAPPSMGDLPAIRDGMAPTIADNINKFCTQSQANYIRCCGAGTLPTSGAMNFVRPEDIKTVPQQAQYDKSGKLIVPLYATVRGNNGLCRKTTEDPTPIVPIPPDVLKDILGANPGVLSPGCCDSAKPVAPTELVKDEPGGGLNIISTLIVKVS